MALPRAHRTSVGPCDAPGRGRRRAGRSRQGEGETCPRAPTGWLCTTAEEGAFPDRCAIPALHNGRRRLFFGRCAIPALHIGRGKSVLREMCNARPCARLPVWSPALSRPRLPLSATGNRQGLRRHHPSGSRPRDSRRAALQRALPWEVVPKMRHRQSAWQCSCAASQALVGTDGREAMHLSSILGVSATFIRAVDPKQAACSLPSPSPAPACRARDSGPYSTENAAPTEARASSSPRSA